MSQNTARFSLTEDRFIQQHGEAFPVLRNASLGSPIVVVLPADTKEDRHLKRLSDGAEPKAEKLIPPYATNVVGGPGVKSAAEHYGRTPKAQEPEKSETKPGEPAKKVRAADRD